MKLLMISGDRSLAGRRQGPFLTLLEEFRFHFERIDIQCPCGPEGESGGFALFDNVWVHPSPVSLLSHAFWISQRGTELVREFGHDVMTVHEYPPFYNGLGARGIHRKTGISAVLEIHHIIGFPQAAGLGEWIGRMLSRLFLGCHAARFTAVRTVNGSVKNQLAAWGVPADRTSVVPSVYLDHALIGAVNNTPKKYDVVFCARLVGNKGLPETIVAMAGVPGATLLVVGDGPLKMKAQGMAKSLGIESRVTFTGWLPTAEDTARAIASGRVFVMNSKSEGNPRVAVEAMSYGLPILATRVGIMPDIVKDGVNGMFIDGTSADLAVKIRVMLGDAGKVEKMSLEAAKVALQFEKKAAIRAYADFLKSCVR